MCKFATKSIEFAGMAKNRLEALKNKPDAPRTAAVEPGQGRSVDSASPSKNADEASELAIGLTANDRVGIQRRLLLVGFNPNGVDGSFGPGTRRAVTAWQASPSLQPPRLLNPDPYRALVPPAGRAHANWVATERARAAATPAPTYQPQPTAQPQPQPTGRPTTTTRDVIDGVGTVRDMIRIFR